MTSSIADNKAEKGKFKGTVSTGGMLHCRREDLCDQKHTMFPKVKVPFWSP